VGIEEQGEVGKLASRNDMKQSWAHSGMKFVSSDERVVDALACVENAYIKRIRLGQHRAILIGAVRQSCQHILFIV